MIKLIITDMDGTFLNRHGDYNRELFQQVVTSMQEHGVKFALVLASKLNGLKNYSENKAKISGYSETALLVSNIRDRLFINLFSIMR